jgi:hypothetical protein
VIFLTVDEASVICVENGHHWRLPKGDSSFEQAGTSDNERVCREVVTERDLFNAFGTFYELPGESAGGFARIRPIATHNRHIKDYASYRGLLVMSGVTTKASGRHLIRSDDGQCALWVGAVDDLWKLGKPRGIGGPWKNTEVKAGQPSDAYLMTGYDHKNLKLSHNSTMPVSFRIEVDISGAGQWVTYKAFTVISGKTVEHQFPDAFAAYWVRLTVDHDCQATAMFRYE